MPNAVNGLKTDDGQYSWHGRHRCGFVPQMGPRNSDKEDACGIISMGKEKCCERNVY